MSNKIWCDYEPGISEEEVMEDISKRMSALTGAGYSGKIDWKQEIAEDYDSAVEYLSTNFAGEDVGIRYKEFPEFTEPKVLDAREKAKDARDKWVKLDSVCRCDNVSAAMITCTGCGSKLSTEHMRQRGLNRCPVCGTDMRTPTQLDKISAAYAAWQKLEQKVLEAEAKAKKKMEPEERWLAKIEY